MAALITYGILAAILVGIAFAVYYLYDQNKYNSRGQIVSFSDDGFSADVEPDTAAEVGGKMYAEYHISQEHREEYYKRKATLLPGTKAPPRAEEGQAKRDRSAEQARIRVLSTDDLEKLQRALLERTVECVKQVAPLQNDRKGVLSAQQNGLLPPNVWHSFCKANTDVNVEIEEIQEEANLIKDDWGKTVMDEAIQVFRQWYALKMKEEKEKEDAKKSKAAEEQKKKQAEKDEKLKKEAKEAEEKQKKRLEEEEKKKAEKAFEELMKEEERNENKKKKGNMRRRKAN